MNVVLWNVECYYNWCFAINAGAKNEEVAIMNGLTVNEHLLLVRNCSFIPVLCLTERFIVIVIYYCIKPAFGIVNVR